MDPERRETQWLSEVNEILRNSQSAAGTLNALSEWLWKNVAAADVLLMALPDGALLRYCRRCGGNSMRSDRRSTRLENAIEIGCFHASQEAGCFRVRSTISSPRWGSRHCRRKISGYSLSTTITSIV